MKEEMRAEDPEARIPSVSNSTSSFFSLNGRSRRLQHLSAATGLILTYLIEIGVQIYLTIHSCRSLIILALNWDWPWFLILSLATSSLIVSSVSLIWVCQSLDFAGRLCGRLLCYVMHFFLLGLPWRYLKLTFAYDSTDVQEFVALRIFQAYIQSVPLTSIHLASLIAVQESWTSPGICLVIAETLSIITALIIASYITPFPKSEFKEQEATTRRFFDSLKCSVKKIPKNDESIMWCRVLKIEMNLISRGILLGCRLVAVALLLTISSYWIVGLILSHLIISSVWVKVNTKNEEDETLSYSMAVECSYVLFWDISSTLCTEVSLRTWSVLALLVLGENLAILGCYYLQMEGDFVFVIATVSCLFVGSVFFLFLNLTNLNQWSHLFGTRIQKNHVPSSLICSSINAGTLDRRKWTENHPTSSPSNIPERRSSWTQSIKTERQKNPKPFIMLDNYRRISESLMKGRKIQKNRSPSAISEEEDSNPKGTTQNSTVLVEERASPPDGFPAHLLQCPSNSPLPMRRGTGVSWVTDACCNDSNGSSNSRNTNTLLDSGPHEQEDSLDTLEATDFVFCYANGIPKWIESDQSRIRSRSQNRLESAGPSTPVEIKTASRVIMNIPKQSKERKSRCPCQKIIQSQPPNDNLIEGSYGILFCEENELESHGTLYGIRNQSSILVTNCVQGRLRVLCAKCFQNHDPLLTDCKEKNEKTDPKLIPSVIMTQSQQNETNALPSETTDYPSETELTCTGVDEAEYEEESVVPSLHSNATWNNNLPHRQTSSSMMPCIQPGISKEFTSREYVRTWLLTSQALQRHCRYKEKIESNIRKLNQKNYYTLPNPKRYKSNEPRRKTELTHSSINEMSYVNSQPLHPLETRIGTPTPSDEALFYKDLEIIV